jgi:N-acetylglutamate synthase-like GNAT family acetyltransferase
MYIDYLYNHPEYIKIVSSWIHSEFVVKAKGSLNLEKVAEYFSNTNIESFPITLIAIIDNECIGTVSIFQNDLKTRKDLIPWLASLYVNSDYRGQGIGEMLINQVKKVVKGLGFKSLYLRTEHTSEYYIRLGWEFVCKTQDEKGQETKVFKYQIR